MLNLRKDKSQIFFIGDRVHIFSNRDMKIDKNAIVVKNDWEDQSTHSDKYKVSFENGYVGWFLPDEMEKL